MLERLRAIRPDPEGTDRTTVAPPPRDMEQPAPPKDLERSTVKDLNRPTIRDLRDAGAIPGAIPNAITSQVTRVTHEFTPAPLPSPPGAEHAEEVLFESVPTSPAGPPDLARLGLGDDTGYTPVGIGRSSAPHLGTVRYRRPVDRVASLLEQPWALPALLAITSLAVGMVIGALLFASDPKPTPAPAMVDDMCVCPEPEPE